MVSQPNRLLQHSTTMSLINKKCIKTALPMKPNSLGDHFEQVVIFIVFKVFRQCNARFVQPFQNLIWS